MTTQLPPRYGREYRAGEVLFREGESGREMFVVQSGVIQLCKRDGDRERPVASFGRGDFLGEMAVISGQARTHTAIVLEDASCLVIERDTLETMVARRPEIAMRLINRLAERLATADQTIELLLHADPRARVVLGLKRRADACGVRCDEGVKFTFSASDLASEVGADPDQVVDILGRLHRLRLAHEIEPGVLVAPTPERLLDFMELLQMPRKFEA